MLLAGGRGSSELVRQGADAAGRLGRVRRGQAARGGCWPRPACPIRRPLLLRRELSADGRGRAFVDDEPAAVRTLARLGERLVAIHGQNSEQELADPSAAARAARRFREGGAGAGSDRAEPPTLAGGARELEALEASRRDRAARLEMLDFQIREIEAVSPDARRKKRTCRPSGTPRPRGPDPPRRRDGAGALSEDEASAADRLGEAARAFAELAAIDPREEAHREEAEDIKRRIADLAAAARDAAEGIEADPDRLTAIETRLEQISRG